MTTKIHFVHVGNMNNKGTQALFKSDIQVVIDLLKDVTLTVSTTDIEGVRRLDLPLNSILSPMVDIPYERADLLSKRLAIERQSLRYKSLSVIMFVSMFFQIPLTLLSVSLVRIGVRSPYRNEVLNCFKNCDVVVSHSDESFKETASLLPLNLAWVVTWWSMLLSRTWDIFVARSFGKPIIVFPNSVGPFRTFIGRWLGRLSLDRCDRVLIRDPISFQIAEELGIKSSKSLTYDTALLFVTKRRADPRRFRKPVIGVCSGMYSNSLSANELSNYIMAHSKALDDSIETHGVSITFLPHYMSGFRFDDLEISKMIREKMKHKDLVEILETESVDEFKSLLDEMDMIITSKMHPAVLGASGFVPILCVAYDHKQTGFFARLNMIECTVGIRDLTYRTMSEKMEYVWNNRKRISDYLKNTIPSWQENVKYSIRDAIIPYAKS